MQTLHLMRHVPGSKSLAQAKKGVDLVVAMGKKLIGRIPHSQEWTLELRRITEKVNLEIPSLELPIAHSFEIRDRQGQAVGLELSAVCPAQFPIEVLLIAPNVDLDLDQVLPRDDARFREAEQVMPLNRGTFSQVLRKMDMVREKVVVVKHLSIGLMWDVGAFPWEREVTALMGLKHPNIVTLLEEPISMKDSIHLVLENMDEDLRQYIKRTRPLTLISLRRAWLQILRGVYHMHKLNWLHRDLKPQPRRFCPLSSQQEYPGELEDTHLEGRRLRLEPEADHSEPRMFWMDWHGWRGTAPSDPGSGDLVVSGARSFVGRSLRQKCGPVVPGMHFWRDGHAMATLRRRLRAWATHVHLSDAGDSLEPVLAGSPISAALQSSLPQVE
ncbi:unnamed protein product [Durusdinium trenchii]|uniref:Cyclin-dependent kinase 2 homolog n=2 Tax=Durusdinium trenchii TaxID=1381693 RepID=A0ABP0NGA1_9DINO